MALLYALISQDITLRLLLVLLLANTAGIWAGLLAVFALGGIGVREITSVAIMAAFMSVEHAVLICILARAWLVIMDLFSGIAAIAILNLNKTVD